MWRSKLVLVVGLTAAMWSQASMAATEVAITVLGQDDDNLADDLKAASLSASISDDAEATARDILAAARADYTRMVEALYAKGYYGPVVTIRVDGQEAARIPPFANLVEVREVKISVDPGRRFRFGRTEIAPLPETAELPPGFARDEPALASTVREAAQSAVLAWERLGYPKARIADQDVIARQNAARLDVALDVAPGQQARFGRTSVTGESTVRPGRVRQIAGLPKGELYSPDDVERAAKRLRRTGTFRSVQLSEGERINPDGTLDYSIEVVDRLPRRIGGGVEISNRDGLTLSGFWLHRNLLRGAERLRIEGKAAQLGSIDNDPDYTLSARFERPAVFGPDTLFFALAKIEYLDEPDFLSQGGEIGAGFSQEFSDTLTAELGVSLRRSRVTDRFAGRDADGDFPVRDLTLFSVPGALTWDRRDDTINPRAGSYLRAEARPFIETSDAQTGIRLAFDGRAYRPVGSTVIAGRVQLGTLQGPDGRDAPPDYLFYSGGGGTVRGQPYQSLDVDYGGEELGGRSFAALSAELRFDVTDAFGLVAFSDAGYVGKEAFFAGDGAWHSGAGLGLRYNTPVGPIRFDVAGPTSGETSEGIQIYIGIGQAF